MRFAALFACEHHMERLWGDRSEEKEKDTSPLTSSPIARVPFRPSLTGSCPELREATGS